MSEFDKFVKDQLKVIDVNHNTWCYHDVKAAWRYQQAKIETLEQKLIIRRELIEILEGIANPNAYSGSSRIKKLKEELSQLATASDLGKLEVKDE